MKPYLLVCILLCTLRLSAQKYDATWVMGYPNWVYKFDSSAFYLSDTLPINKSLFYFLSNGCMSDKNGNLLYISNGLQVNDRNDNLMEGGNQLELGSFDASGDGYDFRQSPLSLPMTGSDSLYYFFYETYWDTSLDQGSRLYYAIIDMSANNGLGKIISLNNILLNTFISDGGLSACKHANGTDWWLLKHKYNSNEYFEFLIEADGVVRGPFTQTIGPISPPPDFNTELVFSPVGDKLFYTSGKQKAVLFDFDRCTGLISNPRYTWGTEYGGLVGGNGASFSPNGRFVYLTGDSFKLYQIDTYSHNIDSSKIILSRFYAGLTPNYHQLAPNGKIYIDGYNSPTPLTIINYPDSLGFACGLDTFAYDTLPQFTWCMPNFPYYRTPPARAYQADAGNDTTICLGDTVRLGVPQVDSVVYQWQSSAGLLGSTDIAQPLAVPQQTTSYYLTINDTVPRGYNCNIRTDTITVTVVPLPCVLGVADIDNAAANIKPYPNPANSTVTIFYNIPGTQPAALGVFSSLGQLLQQYALNATSSSVIINTNTLQDGVYLIRVTNTTTGAIIATKKLVVVH